MLSRVQFEVACKRLIAAECPNSPAAEAFKGWSWNEHPSIPNLGFLTRTVLHVRRPQQLDSTDLDVEESLNEEKDDSAIAVAAETLVSRQYVVYSATFQVPAFYFTVHNSRGTPLALVDLVHTSMFHRSAFEQTEITSFGVTRLASSFPLLSQGDHPTLGTPCWYLHPCETANAVDELMSELELEGYPEDMRLAQWLKMWFVVLGTETYESSRSLSMRRRCTVVAL